MVSSGPNSANFDPCAVECGPSRGGGGIRRKSTSVDFPKAEVSTLVGLGLLQLGFDRCGGDVDQMATDADMAGIRADSLRHRPNVWAGCGRSSGGSGSDPVGAWGDVHQTRADLNRPRAGPISARRVVVWDNYNSGMICLERLFVISAICLPHAVEGGPDLTESGAEFDRSRPT